MNTKKIIITIISIILFILLFSLSYKVLNSYILKTNFEKEILSFSDKNQETIFEINKITFFSSANVKNKNISANSYTIENLYQYTDMAFFINNKDEKTLENTLKKVSIENLRINTSPTEGNPQLYFKSIKHFSKNEIIDTNLIQDRLEFNITSDEKTDLEVPTLYNNLANPITLSYINQNIKTDYTLTDTSSAITFDGTLLKKCNILLTSLTCKLSFDLFITNNLDQKFKSTIFIDIPLENENKTIYDGNLNFKKEVNYKFYRYE